LSTPAHTRVTQTVGWQVKEQNKETMKHIKLFFLMVFFLASCATPKVPEPTQTSTPKPTVTQTFIPTPTRTPVPTQVGGGTGKLIFSYIRTGGYEKNFPEVEGVVNIFTANWDGTDLTPITNGLNGANVFTGVSPDGRKILVSSFFHNNKPRSDGDLYVVYLDDSLEPQKIASGLDVNGGRHAIWLNNDTVSFIAKDEKTPNRVFIIKSDGTGLKRISEKVKNQDGEVLPYSLLPTKDIAHVYWNGCTYTGLYSACKIWQSNTDGSGQSVLHLEEQEDNVISPDGSMIVWNKPVHNAVGDCCALYVSSVFETDSPRSTLENEGNNYQVVWFPDNSKVLLFRPTSKFPTYIQPYAAYILLPTNLTYKQIDLPISKEVVTNTHLQSLSPDGRLLLFKEGSTTKIINMETMSLSEEFTKRITQDTTLGEQTFGLIEWLPAVK
jgi:hypothetical protein